MQDGSVSPIGNFFRNSSVSTKIAILLFLVLVIAAIILAVLTTMQPKEEQNINVVNFSEISNAPEEYQIGTQEIIWQLIEQREPISDFSKYQAVIREGSYREEVDGHIVNASFIVDIEELRYSFEVEISWPKGQSTYSDPSIKIRCPYYTEVIYPDTQCVAELPTAQILRYLPHNYYLEDGHRVHVDQSNFGNELHLLVYIEACKNQEVLDSAMNYAREWIKNLYMEPDDFKMETYDTCL